MGGGIQTTSLLILRTTVPLLVTRAVATDAHMLHKATLNHLLQRCGLLDSLSKAGHIKKDVNVG